jgi:hypothetical protein
MDLIERLKKAVPYLIGDIDTYFHSTGFRNAA